MSKYRDLVKKIEAAQTVINEKRDTLQAAERRIETAQDTLDRLWECFKDNVMSGKQSDIAGIEKTIAEQKQKNERDMALAEGLREIIPKLQTELDLLVKERNEIFTNLALSWLKKESKSYDEYVDKVISSVRRMFIVFNAMRDIGKGEKFKEEIGPAFDYLSGLKLPSIKGFDSRQYLEARHPGLRAGQSEIDAVINGVTKGE